MKTDFTVTSEVALRVTAALVVPFALLFGAIVASNSVMPRYGWLLVAAVAFVVGPGLGFALMPSALKKRPWLTGVAYYIPMLVLQFYAGLLVEAYYYHQSP